MEKLQKLVENLKLVFDKIEISKTTSLDNLLGFDLKKALENIEKELEGYTLQIIVSEKQPSGRVLDHVFEYTLKDDGKSVSQSQMCQSTTEEINKLLDRVEYLQKQYGEVVNEVFTKIDYLEKEFENKDYKITLIKVKKDSATTLKYEPESFCNESLPLMKRKLSFITDPDLDESGKRRSSTDYPKYSDDFEMMTIGPNGTQIHTKDYQVNNWKDAAGATKQLCNIIFGEEILATHSLTGNQSPAFRGRERPDKGQLDPKKTNDITFIVCSLYAVKQRFVRATITAKCSDVSKKVRRIAKRKHSI